MQATPLLGSRRYGRTGDGGKADGGASYRLGDGHESALKTNQYHNPFWNETPDFSLRLAATRRALQCSGMSQTGGTERGRVYGDRLSYTMARPEHAPNTVTRIAKNGQTVLDGDELSREQHQKNFVNRVL